MTRNMPAGFSLALPAYLLLLAALAFMGTRNQALLHEQDALLEAKQELTAEVARARIAANVVMGPQAVAAWARAAGFVPAPEGGTALTIAFDTIELASLPEPSLEVRTAWR